MNISEEIVNSLWNMEFENLLNLIELDSDYSNFTYVDGEEGDYGVVLHSLNGIVLVKQIVEGGDCDYYEITKSGKKFYTKIILERLTEWVKE